MAAPVKQGLDYFPVSVNLFRERGLRRARKKHGYLAQVLYMTLLQMLYADKGYYLDLSDLSVIVWDIQEMLFGETELEESQVMDCIQDLVDGGCFDSELYENGILTSRSVQEVYYTATIKRRLVAVDPAIWMLSVEDMKQLSTAHSLVKDAPDSNETAFSGAELPENGVNDGNMPETCRQHDGNMPETCRQHDGNMPETCRQHDGNNPQSKVNRKEKESSGGTARARDPETTTTVEKETEALEEAPKESRAPEKKVGKVAALYDYARNTGLADLPAVGFFKKWLNRLEDGVIRYALDETAAAPQPSSAYLCGVLKGLQDEGCTTLAQLTTRKQARDSGTSSKASRHSAPPREIPGIHFGHERGPDSFHVVVNDWDAPI